MKFWIKVKSNVDENIWRLKKLQYKNYYIRQLKESLGSVNSTRRHLHEQILTISFPIPDSLVSSLHSTTVAAPRHAADHRQPGTTTLLLRSTSTVVLRTATVYAWFSDETDVNLCWRKRPSSRNFLRRTLCFFRKCCVVAKKIFKCMRCPQWPE